VNPPPRLLGYSFACIEDNAAFVAIHTRPGKFPLQYLNFPEKNSLAYPKEPAPFGCGMRV
jgi:hypothetical protein